MKPNTLTTVEYPIEMICSDCPDGKVPMFRVVSGKDERYVGESVVIKDGHVVHCMTSERIAKANIDTLQFEGYIKY